MTLIIFTRNFPTFAGIISEAEYTIFKLQQVTSKWTTNNRHTTSISKVYRDQCDLRTSPLKRRNGYVVSSWLTASTAALRVHLSDAEGGTRTAVSDCGNLRGTGRKHERLRGSRSGHSCPRCMVLWFYGFMVLWFVVVWFCGFVVSV